MKVFELVFALSFQRVQQTLQASINKNYFGKNIKIIESVLALSKTTN